MPRIPVRSPAIPIRRLASASFVCAAWLIALPVLAGQRRVDVSFAGYAPTTINVNEGDHVTWVWVEGPHSVTSGDSTCPWRGCGIADGVFDSGIQNPAHPKTFSWKATVPGYHYYFCTNSAAHDSELAVTKHARVVVHPGNTIAIADFRITEVQYNRGPGNDLIEITNLGETPGDLGRYRIATSVDSAAIAVGSFVVQAGRRVIVHVNRAGSQSAPDSVFLPTLDDLPDTGSVALFVPNTKTGADFTDQSQIVDYVAWGTGGQPLESVAVDAGMWAMGQALQPLGPGNSLEFCGAVKQYGPTLWGQISPPTWGYDGGCLTPTRRSTWGRLKALYR